MKKNRKKAPRTKDPEVKVVIVGDAEAGKSALLERIGLDTFRSVYKETIGMDFMRHPMPPPPAEHTALWSMWDMGGSEKFDSLAESYCTGANVGLVVFDLVKAELGWADDSSDAFSKLEKRFGMLQTHAAGCLPFLVGTHLDEYRVLPQMQTESPADPDAREARLRSRIKERLTRWGKGDVPFYAVSSKDGTNVQALLNDMARMWMEHKIVIPRKVRALVSGWDIAGELRGTVLLDVMAEQRSTDPDVVTAGSVAAAFVKRHEGVKALPKDVFVRRLGNAAPLPHAELIELQPFDHNAPVLLSITRRQPLTADLYCEMYDPESKDVARVLVSDVGKSEDSLCGTEIVGSTSAVLDKDSPRWLPINAAKRLGLKYQPPEESKWTWERFLAEKGGRAAPMSCFRAMETLAGLVSECEATATVS